MRAEGFEFILADLDHRSFDDVIAEFQREADGVDLGPGRVRSDFLVAEVNGEVVGRTSIRYELTEFLRQLGGHVGFGVAPGHRRRGYATAILQQSLERLHDRGVEDVLVTCDDTNSASAAVIERCSGILEKTVDRPDGGLTRRYWISRRNE